MLTVPAVRFGIGGGLLRQPSCRYNHNPATDHYFAALQAVHRTSSADRALRDAAAEERSTYLHAVGMMPRAFHLLRAMFATGPRVQPLEEVRVSYKATVCSERCLLALYQCCSIEMCRQHAPLAF